MIQTVCIAALVPILAAENAGGDSPEPPSQVREFGGSNCRIRLVPDGFIENAGQWPDEVAFGARLDAYDAFVLEDRVRILPRSARGLRRTRRVDPIELSFEGGRADAIEPVGVESIRLGLPALRTPGTMTWAHRTSRELVLRGVWSDVDVRLRLNAGRVEYLLESSSLSSLEEVGLRWSGGALSRSSSGELRLQGAIGELRQSAPLAVVESRGVRHLADCRLSLRADGSFGFGLDDPSLGSSSARITVDPILEWVGYLGGSAAGETPTAVRSDPAFGVTVAGTTSSFDFPDFGGPSPTYGGGATDGFLVRFDPITGAVTWSLLLGGTESDSITGLALAENGDAVVAGLTRSPNFPTTPGAFDTSGPTPGPSPSSAGFVSRIQSNGLGLAFSTFVGECGNSMDGVEIGPSGAILVFGESCPSLSVPGGYQETIVGGRDAFVGLLSASGSTITHATFLGGSETEEVLDGCFTDDGSIVLCGSTESDDFPATPSAYAPRQDPGSGSIGFVAVLSPTLDALEASTYLGASPGSDIARAVDVDALGRVYVAGSARESFPSTLGSLAPDMDGVADGFVCRLDALLTELEFSTFIGGSGPGADALRDLEVAPSGVSTFAGFASQGAPTTPGALLDHVPAGEGGGTYFGRLSRDGDSLLHGSFFGQPENMLNGEWRALDVAADGSLWLVAPTSNPSQSPVGPQLQPGPAGGGTDGLLANTQLLPSGVERIGASSPACSGPIPLFSSSQPIAGDGAFRVYAPNAPTGGLGIAVVGALGDARGIEVLGASLHVSVLPSLFVWPIGAPEGPNYHEVSLPLPPQSSGKTFAVQLMWLPSESCASPTGAALVATDALEVSIQSP